MSESTYRKIRLTQGKVATVDSSDWNKIKDFKWFAQRKKNTYYAKAKGGRLFLHRLIMDAPENMKVDHIDGDGLNCIRSNMRLCRDQENNHNRRKIKPLSSIYKGVSWHKWVGKWRSQIKNNGKDIHLGHFNSEVAAAQAYDKAAIELFGDFAKLNFS